MLFFGCSYQEQELIIVKSTDHNDLNSNPYRFHLSFGPVMNAIKNVCINILKAAP